MSKTETTEVSPLEEEEAKPSRKQEFFASATAFVVTTALGAVATVYIQKVGQLVHDKLVETKK